MGFRAWGLGFRAWGLGFGFGVTVWGMGFRVKGLGFRVRSLGFRVQGWGVGGVGLEVWGLGLGCLGAWVLGFWSFAVLGSLSHRTAPNPKPYTQVSKTFLASGPRLTPTLGHPTNPEPYKGLGFRV